MKVLNTAILTLLLILSVSCGRETGDNGPTQDAEMGISVNPGPTQGVILIAQPRIGSPSPRIKIGDTTYYIGSKTNTAIKNEINSYAPGEYGKVVSVEYGREKGYMPSSHIEVDVAHIYTMNDL
jgi:hypothetical protein